MQNEAADDLAAAGAADPRPLDPAGGGAPGDPLSAVAARYPSSSAAWAALAERALAGGDAVSGYAFARTGYHRGLDQLRRSGWRGHGPVPWSHAPNQGFLRALHALGVAAGRIEERDEAERCAQFLADCDPQAPRMLGG
jgi:hypothetical protein